MKSRQRDLMKKTRPILNAHPDEDIFIIGHRTIKKIKNRDLPEFTCSGHVIISDGETSKTMRHHAYGYKGIIYHFLHGDHGGMLFLESDMERIIKEELKEGE